MFTVLRFISPDTSFRVLGLSWRGALRTF
jgi:hypothetical protein